MMIVMDMEDGHIVRAPAAFAPEAHAEWQQALRYPQLGLQEVSLPPKAVCPPPPLDIDAFFAAFDD
ncbi:MAG: hypothetical protein LBT71_06910 [Azoarcus sp.]|nr:hypothetical protein [Azoarcus sp.]